MRMPPRTEPPLHPVATPPPSVSHASALLARRIRHLAMVLKPKTLPPASRHRATGKRATAPSRARVARGDPSAARGPPPRLDRATRPWPSRPSGRPRVADHRAAHGSREPDSARHCAAVLNRFSIVLNSRNCFKIPKFIETFRNVQKLKNKFCWTTLEPLYTVGLTKLTFMQ
jgi:hypothetical protein